MNQRSIGALIAINVSLLLALVLVILPAPATAQGSRGDYVILAGNASGVGGDKQAVYIIETRTSRMVALTFTSGGRGGEINYIGARDMAPDITGGPQSR